MRDLQKLSVEWKNALILQLTRKRICWLRFLWQALHSQVDKLILLLFIFLLPTEILQYITKKGGVENSLQWGSDFAPLVLTTQAMCLGHAWACFLPCDINILRGFLWHQGAEHGSPVCLSFWDPAVHRALFPCHASLGGGFSCHSIFWEWTVIELSQSFGHGLASGSSL